VRFMICRSRFFPLLLVLSFVSATYAQETVSNQTGSIRGTVLDTRTGQPVAGATVTVRGVWGSEGRSSTAAAPDGSFSLRGLPPGRYRVEASQSGYVDSMRSHEGFRGNPAAMISVSAGQTVDDVIIRLAPAGSIAGRILNGSEQPLTGILVAAMKASYRDGQREFSDSHTAFTDDHGEFRISGLAPGHYYIKATAPRGWEKGPAPAKVYVPVFYPGVSDPTQTQPVELRPGDEMNGINLTLNLQRAVHVKGRILTSNGRGAKGAEVSLSQIPSSGYVIEAEADAAGRFDIAAVPPGSYLLEAQLSEDGDSGRVFMGRAAVSVVDTNVEVPDVAVFSGATVSGHIRVEGDRKISMGRTRASLRPVSSSEGGDVSSAMVQADGSFEFHDVPEGTYRVQLSSPPDGYYRKLAADDAGGNVVVSHGHGPAVEIRLDSGAAQIQGSVYSDGENQHPAPSAAVVLIPDASRRGNSENYRFTLADRSGKFSLRSVPPGEYLILAFEEIDRDAYMDPEFIQQHEDAGKNVRVEEGGNLSIQLQTTLQ
jgi:Carboxypeptidase regulatory-like domain